MNYETKHANTSSVRHGQGLSVAAHEPVPLIVKTTIAGLIATVGFISFVICTETGALMFVDLIS